MRSFSPVTNKIDPEKLCEEIKDNIVFVEGDSSSGELLIT